MKATLTIEVPDGFTKGNCHECPYVSNFFGGCKVKSLTNCLGTVHCPLEIQGKCETCKNIATPACADCSVGTMNYYEKSAGTIDLIKENNQ